MHHTSKMQVYHEDSAVSDSYGTPVDSLTNYFLFTIKFNDKNVSTGIDTFNFYSIYLYALNEKVLSNYYLGHDQYRFLLLRSFDPPIAVTLHRKGSEVWLNA
ncbi:hypothetical protein [Pontibacter mangrovi]|nr:hypothetical protein [Pontibacter mangrovi]